MLTPKSILTLFVTFASVTSITLAHCPAPIPGVPHEKHSGVVSARLPPYLPSVFFDGPSTHWKPPPHGWIWGNWKLTHSSNPIYLSQYVNIQQDLLPKSHIKVSELRSRSFPKSLPENATLPVEHQKPIEHHEPLEHHEHPHPPHHHHEHHHGHEGPERTMKQSFIYELAKSHGHKYTNHGTSVPVRSEHHHCPLSHGPEWNAVYDSTFTSMGIHLKSNWSILTWGFDTCGVGYYVAWEEDSDGEARLHVFSRRAEGPSKKTLFEIKLAMLLLGNEDVIEESFKVGKTVQDYPKST